MKTLRNSLRNLTAGFAALLIISSAFLTGCQKDEITPAGAERPHAELGKSSRTYTDAGQNSNFQNARIGEEEYLLLIVDHYKGFGTKDPSYRVELRSSGNVVFEGLANTNVIGMQEWIIDDAVVEKIRDLFIQSGFEKMDDYTVMDDQSQVLTTFARDFDSDLITKFDDLKDPQQLIELRKKAETLMGIDKYVNAK